MKDVKACPAIARSPEASCRSAPSRGGTRPFWIILGTISLSLGAVGLVVPLLPTTPFVLAAAGCYMKGSVRMHEWMVRNRLFGGILRSYQEGRGVTLRVKMGTLAFLWVSLAASYLLLSAPLLVLLVIVLVGAAVTIHVLMIPTASGPH